MTSYESSDLRHENGALYITFHDIGETDIFVEVEDESPEGNLSGNATFVLTPARARRLAKALKKAAKHAEAGE